MSQIFPLPLTPQEEFFWISDRPDNPSTFACRLQFSAPLQPEVLQEALDHAAKRHPLTRCHLALVDGAWSWVEAENQTKVEWLDGEAGFERLADRVIDLKCEGPIRLVGHDGSNGQASLMLLIHHCAMDGLGAIQWISDWLTAYRQIEAGQSPSGKTVTPKRLKLRCRPQLTWRERLMLLPGQWRSVRETGRMLSRKAIPLVNWSPPAGSEQLRAGFVEMTFTRKETTQIKQAARKLGSSLNTLAARDLLSVLNAWQTDSECVTEGTHFRVMIPINERTRSMRDLPACNHCTMINLDFTRDAIADERHLLSEVDRRMNLIQRWKLSLNLWRALAVFRKLPGGLEKYVRTDRIPATALLTNLGRVLQPFCGPASTTNPAESPVCLTNFQPLAMLTRGLTVAFALYYFNHQLRVSLHFDLRYLSQDQAQSLADRYRRKLLQHDQR